MAFFGHPKSVNNRSWFFCKMLYKQFRRMIVPIYILSGISNTIDMNTNYRKTNKTWKIIWQQDKNIQKLSRSRQYINKNQSKTSKAQQNESKSTKIAENGEKFDMIDHQHTKFCQNGKNAGNWKKSAKMNKIVTQSWKIMKNILFFRNQVFCRYFYQFGPNSS